MQEQHVGIVPERGINGISSLSEAAGPVALPTMPIAQALRCEFPTDAHLICYRAVDEDGQVAYMRINKRCAALREFNEAGCRVEALFIAVDWDLPKVDGEKVAWRDMAQVQEFCAQLQATHLPNPTAFYTTRHGARFIYQLTRPVPVQEVEPLIGGLLRDFESAGIAVDKACKDWTRLFRLPCVLRSGGRSEQDASFLLSTTEATLDPDSITPVEARSDDQYADVAVEIGDQPDPTTCHRLLYLQGTRSNREVMSSWSKVARKYLKGRDCYPYLFEHAVLPDTTERNNTLARFVGSMIGLLFHRDGSSPEGVYALLHPLIDQFDPDEDTPSWHNVAWDMVCRFWTNEAQQRAANELKQTSTDNVASAIRTDIRSRLTEMHPDKPELKAEGREAWAAMESQLIAAAPRGDLYVMQPDGTYSPMPVESTRLHAHIAHLGMGGVFTTHHLKGDTWQRRRAGEMVDEYGIPVARVTSSPRETVARIKGEGEDRHLVLPCHQLREDIEPAYDPQVAEWLHLFGGDEREGLLEWLAFSLEVVRPICALNMVKASGAGKNMLVQGVAECFKKPEWSDWRALDRFNMGLLHNPVIHVEEGIPTLKGTGMPADEVIRQLVTGGNISIEHKGRDIIHATLFPRLMMSSNNMDIMSAICGRRDLGPHDIQALETRILTVEVPTEAQQFLTAHGNRALTWRWVEDDRPSELRLARHILHLFHNRQPSHRGSGRLLVEGRRHTRLMREMSLRTPIALATIRAISEMIENQGAASKAGFHVDPETGLVHVVPSAVVSYYEKHLQPSMRTELNPKTVGIVLRKVCHNGEAGSVRRLKGQAPSAAKQKWWYVNTEVLMHEALACGYKRDQLEKLFVAANEEVSLQMLLANFETQPETAG